MDIPAWVWFVVAAVAAVAGVALLLRDRSRDGNGTNRERSRWAALRGWQYIESDEQLLDHWAGGAIAYYPEGTARDVVIGSTFTANGRRPVYVADSVRDGAADFVLVAVRCRRRLDAYLELWLPSVPFQREQMPDLLGPVGQRYAFVSDVEATRPLITSDLADAAEQIGGDVNVVWLEGYWVVAAAPPNCSSARLERLLRDLGELADLVDPFEEDGGGAHHGGRPGAAAPAQPVTTPAHIDKSHTETPRAETPGTETPRAEASHPDTSHAEPGRYPQHQPEQSRPETNRAEPVRSEPGPEATVTGIEQAASRRSAADAAATEPAGTATTAPEPREEPDAAPDTQDVPAPPWQRAQRTD